ncbi:MAG: DNA methyltransferase, partial [Candidatus Marinimicrobia bacterium]|nr:DNA methyltransferase [Candidatus Neomarinimicrobiota bacterium]
NLKKFLTRELDYFLKNEVLSLDFLSPDWNPEQAQKAIEINLLTAAAIRELALQIISFLHETEEFQKRLWEKKKFVVQSDYCMTMDRIPEKVYDDIVEHILTDKDQKQLKNWQDLAFIENLKIDKDYIKAHDKLVLDTQYLPRPLKYRPLSGIDNLDEQTGGLLINSENWQALNLLQKKYENKIKCVYIDPPYNSKSSEIIYKNTYKHSSWISMMENRIANDKKMRKNDCVFICAIDENEQNNLGILLALLFPDSEKTCISIVHNPGGIQGDNFSYTHEYAFFIYPKGGRYIGLENRQDQADIRPLRDVSKGDHLREAAANCFYPIYIKNRKIIGFGDVCNDSFHPTSANVIREDGIIEIYPIDSKGNERKWVFARNTVESIKDELKVEYNKKRKILDIIRTKTNFNYKTVWTNTKYNSNIYGSKILNNIMGKEVFSFPKSLYNVIDCIDSATCAKSEQFILDYFAGSGTTGHAVINLNREDGGQRKYILVEMGEYFDTVTKPRIQKVMYTRNWKNGKPQDMDGYSHIFQYLKLEQYEDTLNNIRFRETPEAVQAFSFRDRIQYLLGKGAADSVSLMNIEKFSRPFDYTLDILKLNERQPIKIDLVTTFNYLLGIEVRRYLVEDYNNREYHIVIGEHKGQAYQIVWRNFDKKLDLAKERYRIKAAEWFDENAETFCNGDNAFGAQSIEAEFYRLMFEDVANA